MFTKSITLLALVAFASAGAPAVQYLGNPHFGAQAEHTVRGFGGLSSVSQYSKQVSSPYSHVTKSDTRITNDLAYAAPAYAHAPDYAHQAYSAAPIAHGYAAPAYAAAPAVHHAYSAPIAHSAYAAPIHHGYAAPAVHHAYSAPVAHAAYAAPVGYGHSAYAAPVTKFSHAGAPGVASLSYSGLGFAYGY